MGNYLNIGWIGAGNASWHLAPAFENAGHRISIVYNRTESRGKSLINRLYNANFSTDLDFSEYPLDIIIVCVSDNALSEVVAELIVPDHCAVVHTSGGTSLDVLKIVASDHYGVLYPLQTFTAGKKIDLSKIPFFIEGTDMTVINTLNDLARSVSKFIYQLDSESRIKLHLAAVISSNFSNYLVNISKQLLDEIDLDYKVLYPVLSETINKAFEMDPDLAQTGPARRADYDTIDNHMELLKDYEGISSLYQMITTSIIKTYHP
jgi:predicted short-subunit dehydrogenase-like oxidoreductase (DUF2520 family)